MHLSDGIISNPILISSSVVAVGSLAWGLKKLDHKSIPKTALLTASFYLASLVHIPTGPTSAHLMLTGLIGIMLGSRALVAIFVALLLQFLTFSHGGISTLGLNVLIMGMPALAVFYLYKVIPTRPLSGFICGSSAVLMSGVLTALTLYLCGDEYKLPAAIFFGALIPQAIAEGIITSIIITTLGRIRPELLKQ